MLRDSVIGKPIWKQTGSGIPHTTSTISATAPFAFQPGHLYEGDAQDNADDKRVKEGKGLTFDMLGGKRLAEVAWKPKDWWTHWYHPGHPIRLPLAVDCHHHAAPKTFADADGGVLPSVLESSSRRPHNATVYLPFGGNGMKATLKHRAHAPMPRGFRGPELRSSMR